MHQLSRIMETPCSVTTRPSSQAHGMVDGLPIFHLHHFEDAPTAGTQSSLG